MLSLSACRKSLNNKFLHAVRLREMELNFVFLRAVTVHWYCSRAKNEKRQKQLGLDVQAVFQSLRFASLNTSLYTREAQQGLFDYILAWFRPLYRQSESTQQSLGAFLYIVAFISFRVLQSLPSSFLCLPC